MPVGAVPSGTGAVFGLILTAAVTDLVEAGGSGCPSWVRTKPPEFKARYHTS